MRVILTKLVSGLVILSAVVLGQTKNIQPPVVVDNASISKLDLSELVTDRPDFTESTQVVGAGVFQFENGFTLDNESHVRGLTGPEALVRIGVSKRLELRLGGAGFRAETPKGSVTDRGMMDFELGVKILLFDQSRFRPACSLIPLISMPTGSDSFSSGGYDPTVKVALAKDLIAGFTLGGNVNFSSFQTPEGRFRQTAVSASLGHELPGGFGAYWEVFGFSPSEKDGMTSWIANTGVTHKITKNAQVDVRGGRRLTSGGPDWFFGVGMAIRQPTHLLAR